MTIKELIPNWSGILTANLTPTKIRVNHLPDSIHPFSHNWQQLEADVNNHTLFLRCLPVYTVFVCMEIEL